MSFKKSEIFPFLLFFLSFSVYLFTATPSLYWRDAPEFQAIGFLLDIAHPSGSPLYAIVAKLFTFFPIGSVGFKVTLLSSFFGAALSVLVYFILRSIIIEFLLEATDNFSLTTISLVSLMVTMIFSFSNALWKNSNIPEVYSFQVFFTAIFLLILVKVSSPHPSSYIESNLSKFLFSFAFLYGLSLGAHSVLVFYFPFFLLYIYIICLRSHRLSSIKTIFLLAFFFLIGFSVYLYLPIRSTQNPFYDWGDPETFFNLMAHVSDRKDSTFHTMFSIDKLISQLKLYAQFYLDNFSIMGVVLGIIGLIFLIIKKEKSLLNLLALLFLPPFLFFIRYWWEESAFLINFLIFSLLIGNALWILQKILQKKLVGHPRRIFYLVFFFGLLGIQLLVLVNSHFILNNKSTYWAPKKILKSILSDIPPNAIIFSSHSAFGFFYLQQVEGYRPDISFFSVASFLAPELFLKVEQSKFPNIILPDLESNRLGAAFLEQNVWRNPIYWEPDKDKNSLVQKYLIPEAFLFRVSRTSTQLDAQSIRNYLSALSKQVQFNRDLKDIEERRYYALIIGGQGSFFLERGAIETAKRHFEMGLGLFPNDTYLLNALGVTHASLNEYEQAEELFFKAIDSNPFTPDPYLNLGKMYAHRDMREKAEHYFKEVLSFRPNHVDALASLGKLSAEKGDKAAAKDYLNKALEFSPGNEDLKMEFEELLRIDSEGEDQ